jgi:hypothetical protein
MWRAPSQRASHTSPALRKGDDLPTDRTQFSASNFLSLGKGCARQKPSARRIERLLAKVEAELACSARPRRYCFHYDEVAEAEAQGLPYMLVPRTLSREEWEKKYCVQKGTQDD